MWLCWKCCGCAFMQTFIGFFTHHLSCIGDNAGKSHYSWGSRTHPKNASLYHCKGTSCKDAVETIPWGQGEVSEGKFNLIFYVPDAPPLLKIRNNADLNWTACVTAVVDNKGQRGLNYVAQRCQTVTWEGEWQGERRVKQGGTGETAAGGSERQT